MRLTLVLLLLLSPQETSNVTGKISAPEGAAQRKLRAKIRYAGPGAETHTPPDPSPAVVWLEKAPAAKMDPKTLEIRQEGLELRPRVVAIPVGSTVKFPNQDDLFHNIFSYSKAKRFDLGRYPKGESKSETFDTKGQVDLRCEVHEFIRGYIHVFDHPYYAVAGEDGSYTIPKVPRGKYTLVAWKEFFEPVRQDIEVNADGAKVDVTMARFEDRPDERKIGGACCDVR
jgi:plastocyanin